MDRKTLLITLAKITLSLGILGYLIYSAVDTPEKREAFFGMLQQHKAWGFLIAGFVTLLSVVVLTMVRWWYLVRAWASIFRSPTPCGSALSATSSILRRWVS